jgi:NarL family two-component system response regulator LiaR
VSEIGTIRVMLVDDHAVVRSGLAAFLLAFDDLELVGDAADGEEALRKCREVRPDVVLMDLVMPGMDGAAAARAIREEFPETEIVALTSFKNEEFVTSALEAGAIGYLLKNVSAEELAEAIRSTHAGRLTLSPEATHALVQSTRKSSTPRYELTAREVEVLALMVEGLNNPEIAERLAVTRSTAKFHVSNILSKLGVGSRVEAVALALQHDLVT